jgi:hypothetical protein
MISQAAVQGDVESQLRLSGIALSRVHTARLAAEVDCTPLVIGGRIATIGVRQCLSISETVPAPSGVRGLTLATTWRKCGSLTCAGRRCQAVMESDLRGLVDVFISHFRELNAGPGLQAQAVEGVTGVVKPQPVEPGLGSESSHVPTAISVASTLKVANLYYTLYILTCLAVLGYWLYQKTRCSAD